MSDVVIPTVHINGTSKSTLHTSLSHARRTLLAAVEALKETEPHGRDYYMHGRETFKSAQDAYVGRLDRLESVYNEVCEILEGVDAQGAPVASE